MASYMIIDNRNKLLEFCASPLESESLISKFDADLVFSKNWWLKLWATLKSFIHQELLWKHLIQEDVKRYLVDVAHVLD